MIHFHCTEHHHLRSAFAALAAEEGKILPCDQFFGGHACIGWARGETLVTVPLTKVRMLNDFVVLDRSFLMSNRFAIRRKIDEWILACGNGLCKDRCDICLADLVLSS